LSLVVLVAKPSTKNAISRRTCLAALAGAPFLAGANKKITVAGHPWVYAAKRPRNEIYEILDQIFGDMHAAGLDAIELMHTALAPDDAVAHIRELSKRHDLPVIGTSFGAAMWDRQQHEAILAQARVVIERVAAVAGRTLGTSVGDARHRKTDEELDAQAGLLRKIIAIGNDHGVVLNLHNHIYEVADGEHDLKGTLARIPDVRLGPDLNWLIRAGVDPVDFITRYGTRIVYAHLRDQQADGKWCEAMGEGATDYAAIAAAFRKVGFQGDVAIELAHERDFQPTRSYGESFALSRKYVRRVMGW
jgi:sugar phosphate isomerase/epimerase